MKKRALDTWDVLPKEMEAYLRHNGWHFNKKACEYAVGLMLDQDGNKAATWDRQQVDDLLKRHGVRVKDTNNYDYVYVANMCRSDNLGGSVPDELHLAMHVKETMEDKDAGEGQVMRRWYSDMVGKGEMVMWEELV